MSANVARLPSAVLAALALAAVASGAALGRPAAKPSTLLTKAAIEAIGLDGRLLAYDLAARPPGCNTVHVRDLRSGRDVVVSGPGTCEADSTSTGAGVRELAVAGRRVAWIVNLGGNTESIDTLYTATVGGGKEKKVARARRTGDVDSTLTGDWLGNLAGDGGLIALNAWKTAGATVVAPRLVTLGAGLVTLHRGPGSLAVASVDTGRIAVLDRAANRVDVYGANGAPVCSFAPAGQALEVALRKDYVVVLAKGGSLEVHLASTGALLDTISVPPGARHLDVHANVAAFVVGKTVRAVRLATGSQATIATAPKAIVGLALDDAGLAYAYNPVTGVEGAGRLVFVPLSLVQAKLA